MSKIAHHCFLKGNKLLYMQQYEEAIKAYEEAIKIDPNFLYSYNGKGDALSNLGRYQDAIDAYNQAMINNPARSHALICIIEEDIEKNIKKYKISNNLYIRNDSLSTAGDDLLSDAKNKLKECHETLKTLARVSKINPNLYAKYGVANALKYLGEYNKAIEECNAAIEINKNPDFKNVLKKMQEDLKSKIKQEQDLQMENKIKQMKLQIQSLAKQIEAIKQSQEIQPAVEEIILEAEGSDSMINNDADHSN